MPIRVLPPPLVSKIAAGEVVERPASVVKELVENAIDAGASDIRIEISQGGRRLIRVSDDGYGISQEDTQMAFQRHATSKICNEEDLFHIATLGFRGEALASIAAVSQVTMLTRTESEAAGSLLRLEGGELVRKESHGTRQGTIITVENLFYNTPARLKFLRSEATESSHIIKLVSAYAMAYPELRFSLIDQGRLTLQSVGDGKLYDVLIKVLGLETAQQMLEVRSDPETPENESQGEGEHLKADGQIRVHGYVGNPSVHRSSRDHQFFFVNRRWIQDRSLSYAVEEACRTLIPSGRYPLAVLGISMATADVDVNVHPTKREVRFRNPRDVFAAVQRAVRHTIVSQSPVTTMSQRPATVMPAGWPRQGQLSLDRHASADGLTRAQLAMEIQRTADIEPFSTRIGDSLPGEANGANAPMPERLPMLRVLGQVRRTYIIAEGPDGLYLIDQHAAHERILFEQLQAEQANVNAPLQRLLEPIILELSPHQCSLLETSSEHLATFGFEIVPFGGNTFLVRAIPAALNAAQVADFIGEWLDVANEGLEVAALAERTLAIIACHSAVRAGQTLSFEETRELIRQLEKTAAPYTCPHGRPTMIHLSSAQLEKSFSRA